MPFKRPAPLPHDSSHSQSESSSLLIPSSKRPRVSNAAKALPTVKLYIIQAKLDAPALAELFVLAEGTVECICKDVKDANVVVTGISMRRRLERHIPWELAKQKAVVTPQWLRDSVEHGAPLPCEDYAALQDLRAETAAHCPDCNLAPCACSDVSSPSLSPGPTMGSRPPTPGGSQTIGQEPPPTSPTSASAIAPKARSRSKPTSKPASKPAPGPSTRPAAEVPVHLLPPSPPIPTNAAKLDFRSRYTCQRASPLECPNSGLVGELDIMRRARAMEGEERSALSYARAVAAIKAYPGRIRSLSQVETLPYIGTKISGMVEEFLETGKIGEAQTLLASPRFRTLSLFSSIYGSGPTTARRLYNLGLRSLQDLEIYYGVERRPMPSGGTVKIEEREMVELEAQTPRWHGRQARGGGRARGFGEKGEGDEGLGDSWIRIALEIREDLSVKVPRDEVEEMNRVVMAELNALEPGCVSTIVGGYRRGKPESNDVDIVFTHPNAGRVKGLCKRFVRRLHERGMVTHVMHLSGFHGHNPLRTTHWDSLEKALTIFVLPQSSPFARGIRRRLDLIFAPPEVYWTAVIGWSGSIMFQRDLRQWAKDKCAMKFDSSGITRRYDSKQFFPKTEKEVFDLFGLEWVDPTMRNADA